METRKGLEDRIIEVLRCRLKDQHETDREMYRDVLDERYYFGYLDGQKGMIKLIEQYDKSNAHDCARGGDLNHETPGCGRR